MAIPGTPHCIRIGFLHVDCIAYALSHIIQFLNLFGCHHRYLLRLDVRSFEPKSGRVQGLKAGRCGVFEENGKILPFVPPQVPVEPTSGCVPAHCVSMTVTAPDGNSASYSAAPRTALDLNHRNSHPVVPISSTRSDQTHRVRSPEPGSILRRQSWMSQARKYVTALPAKMPQ